MNTIRTMLGITLATSLAVSCSNDDTLSGSSNYPEDNVVRVTANVNDARTRSLATETLSEFYLSIHNPSNDSYSYASKRFEKNNESEWVSDNQLLWQNEEQPVDIIAVCNNNEWSDLYTYYKYIDEDQTNKSNFDRQDLLICKMKDFVPKNDLVNKKLNISFRHALSLLNIQIVLGTEFNVPEIPMVTPIDVINITDIYSWAKVDCKQNPIAIDLITSSSWSSVKYDIKPYHEQFSQAATPNDHSEDSYACILMPQTIEAGKFQVKLDINGTTYIWSSPTDVTLESGKSYQLNLTVGKDIITAENITSRAWEQTSGGGSLETE